MTDLTAAEQATVDRFETAPDAPESLRMQVAAAITEELTGRCSHCLRPIASDDDWKSYRGGEGDHLCWETAGSCGFSFPDLSVGSVAATAAIAVITGGAA